MKVVRPVQDFDFHSEDGKLQYARPQGTLEHQQKVFADGGFSWLSAADVREMIVDNPEFGQNWHRTGTGTDYVHQKDGAVKLYLSPATNRILAHGADYFNKAIKSLRQTSNVPVDKMSIDALVIHAGQSGSGIQVVDLDELQKNKAWVSDNKEYGHLVLSAKDYAKQMQDDPNVASLVTPFYGTGATLEGTMIQVRQRYGETWAYALMPDYVRANAPEGTGVARLSALGYFNSNSYANASYSYIDYNSGFAFGVRQSSSARSADAPKIVADLSATK